MANRHTTQKKRPSSQKRHTSSKGRPRTNKNTRSKGQNKKRSNIHPGKALFLVIFIFIFSVWAQNDFQIDETIEDFRNLTFLDNFFGEAQPAVVFSDDFYGHVAYLASLYPEGRDVHYLDVMTISASDWEYEQMLIGGHDDLGRTLPIIAYLSEQNLGRSESRGQQSHQPTGWSQNRHDIDGSEVWVKNRGHLIAYTLSFNFNEYGEFSLGYLGSDDDPYNLFTQTAHSNQNIMTQYEGQIRDLLSEGCEVVFKSAPVFRDDELMARGIWLQAASFCDDFTLSVYIFNEQPGIKFDHATGENWVIQ